MSSRDGEAHRHRLERLAHLVGLDETRLLEMSSDDGAWRRGRTVTRPSAASRPIASRIGPRLTPSARGQRDLLQLGPPAGKRAGEDLLASGACGRAARG